MDAKMIEKFNGKAGFEFENVALDVIADVRSAGRMTDGMDYLAAEAAHRLMTVTASLDEAIANLKADLERELMRGRYDRNSLGVVQGQGNKIDSLCGVVAEAKRNYVSIMRAVVAAAAF